VPVDEAELEEEHVLYWRSTTTPVNWHSELGRRLLSFLNLSLQ
jgi:hypothetical protein